MIEQCYSFAPLVRWLLIAGGVVLVLACIAAIISIVAYKSFYSQYENPNLYPWKKD